MILNLHAEELTVTRRQVIRPVVARVSVVTEPAEITVPAWAERAVIETVAVRRTVGVAPEPYRDGNTHVVPVVAEYPADGRLEVVAEVRVTIERVARAVTLTGTVRRSKFTLVHPGDPAPVWDSDTPDDIAD